MKSFSLFVLMSSFFVVGFAHAAGIGSTVTSNYQNPKDTKGLCTPDNEQETYMAVGLCQSLWESLNNGCAKEVIEKIRKRVLDEGGNQEYFDMGFYCGSEAKGGKKSRGMSEIAKDPKQFTYLIMQVFSAVAAKTSNWDVMANTDEKGQPPSMDKKQGVLSLSTKEMLKGDYKCGCQDRVETCPTGDQFGDNEVREESLQGGCPGAIDGHHSMTCGAYMALYHAEKDGTLFGGKTKQGGNAQSGGGEDGPKGAARIFKVLEDDNKDTSAQKDPDDPEDSPTTKGFIRKKMKAFCKNDGASQVGTFNPSKDDITLDGQGNPVRSQGTTTK